MTVGASDVALGHLSGDRFDSVTAGHHPADAELLVDAHAVVEVQYPDIGFSAVDARVLKEMRYDVGLDSLSNNRPSGLDRCTSALSVLGVPNAVAVAAAALSLVRRVRTCGELVRELVLMAGDALLHPRIVSFRYDDSGLDEYACCSTFSIA